MEALLHCVHHLNCIVARVMFHSRDERQHSDPQVGGVRDVAGRMVAEGAMSWLRCHDAGNPHGTGSALLPATFAATASHSLSSLYHPRSAGGGTHDRNAFPAARPPHLSLRTHAIAARTMLEPRFPSALPMGIARRALSWRVPGQSPTAVHCCTF